VTKTEENVISHLVPICGGIPKLLYASESPEELIKIRVLISPTEFQIL
jgi:hypothetical protein